ncbi:sigma-70 family RNA polymerase sigma factor [Pseudokineococcus basanitobsidens]|uniref:Sigma-70 family RNA polymerase sigma factor n=1 Tax=Pseudokineococcus basanitobsidens TaxID=1926649 RepID=A0ABU8RFZ8_9ACTN
MSAPPFALLVEEHWRDVARLARALAGPVDGDDVAQQAWAQALAAYPPAGPLRDPRAWLLVITSRCATDVHRARARRPTPVEEVPDVPAGGADPALGELAEADPVLWDAVRALPGRQRTALVLRYVADLDHAGVAVALGTTPGATRRLVSDALGALRRALAEEQDVDGRTTSRRSR